MSWDDFFIKQLDGTIYRASEVGKQVAEIRKKAGLTQEQLATMVSTRQSGIARLEADRDLPSTKLLVRIADVLGYEVKIVFVPTPPPNESV